MIKNTVAIRDDINIVDVIGEYVPLKRRGVTFVGLCPFHTENSPSFTVYPATNTFKCFGCGEGGDAIHFLIENQGMTFPEALEKAASICSISVEYDDRSNRQEVMERSKQEKDRKTLLSETLHTVHKYYADRGVIPAVYCDIESKTELVDADGRLLKRSTVDEFGMCFTPNDNLIHASGYWEPQILEDLGVIGKGDYGPYDFFKRRMIFRITDHRGKIVGLAGRRPAKEDHTAPGAKQRAKYINSKESLLYNKGELLFGLFENRKGIKDAGFATLVEGYMDVITPHDNGVCNMVAPCGTALTEHQATLLKRYTDEVLILRDGDSAGLEAAKRDVETLVKAGLKVRICRLQPPPMLVKNINDQKISIKEQEKLISDPELDKTKAKRSKKLLEGMIENLEKMQGDLAAFKDPDTFIRRHGKAGFDFFLEESSEDAIIWRVMCEYDGEDVFKKETATQVAAQLLGLIQSDTLRDFYIRELCKTTNLGSVKSILNSAIKQNTDARRIKSDLSAKQKQDIINYGIYDKDQKYFIASDVSGVGWAVSNFTVKPIIFIEGAKESIRLVEITNDRKITRILDINSRNFVELGPFKQAIEARGNYRFEGKPEHFAKVKAKIYDEMRTAFPIYTLGQHKEGFFTFANGLVHEGKFYPVDEYGLVSFGDHKYYLPAFSKIRDHIKADDVDNDYQDEQYYVYTPGELPITFHDWTNLMRQVHGENAITGILYICSCFIRDVIFDRLDNMFPHLSFFGLPGSGKNQLAASLMAIFGKYRPPVHIVNATDAAFFRRIAQLRCGCAWYDEYSNNVDHKRVEALKQFADGTGRSRAQVDNPNRTTSTAVNAGCIISGQQQPTADVALFTRCISLSFSNTEFSIESKERHARLKKIEQEGLLTGLAAMLHNLRGHMSDHFLLEFDATYTRFQELLQGNSIMDRIVRSYTAMLTTYRLLKDKIQFAFTEAEVEAILVKSILTQREAVYQENEVSIWWRMVEFFLANGEIEHGTDIVVEESTEEIYDLDWKGSKEISYYKPAKRLLYFYVARAHPLYLERHQRQRNAKGLDMEALKYYLKASGAWQGWKRAKKFQGVAKACLVFDVEKLPFEIEDTVVALSRKKQYSAPAEVEQPAQQPVATAQAVTAQPAIVEESPIDEKLPF